MSTDGSQHERRHIVTVGYDGSSRAARAVEWAATEAVRHNAVVRVVACYSPPPEIEPWVGPTAFDVDRARTAAEQQLDSVVTLLVRHHPTLEVQHAAVFGPPAERLVAEADRSDLLVVATAGHRAFDAWRLGSVAHTVARRAACPVVLVPDVAIGAEHARVVVGVDGSPAAARALTWACDEADARDAELLVVHVWFYPYGTELSSPTGRDLTRVDAARTLDAALEDARARQRGPVRGELIEGSVAAELLDQSARADLVVLGSRGQNLVRSALFGSVTHAVSARACCPTVILRELAR